MALRDDVEAPVGTGGGRRRRVWPQLAVLGAVLVAALAVGSGLTGAPTTASRVAGLEGDVRCPSCEDVSVADSEAPSAVAVRHQIAQMVAAGRSDGQIESSLVARYGPTILLRPPTSGASLFVWVIPLLAGAAAATGLVVLFVRRSRELGHLKAGPP